MIDELIVEIKKAEKKAEELIRSTTVAAKELVIGATASAEVLINKAAAEIKQMKDTNFAKAEDEAKVHADKIIAAANKAAASLKSDCDKVIDQAADLVVGRILNKYATN